MAVFGDRDVEVPVGRIPLFEVYMRMAGELAKRSTYSRLKVGTVITDARLENVLAIGYNGNAKDPPNRCDSSVPGNSVASIPKSTRWSSHRVPPRTKSCSLPTAPVSPALS